MTKSLQESEAWAVINANRLGHLGCIDHEEPYVVPVNYVVEDGRIYSHSLLGRKIQALRTHARACLQVEKIQNDFHWQSAIAFGSYEEVTDAQKRAQILHQLLAHFPELTPVESDLVRGSKSDVVIFCLRVDEVTGVAEE